MQMTMDIEQRDWGMAPQGRVEHFTLTHGELSAGISTLGAAVTSLRVPGRNGPGEVVLGYDSLDQYVDDQCYFGSIVGRVANRISNAAFVLDATTHRLDANAGRHHLHGGSRGFSSRVWKAEAERAHDGPAVRMELVSPDREMGYPGTVRVEVVYTLLADGLRLDISAVSDAPTPFNPASHVYFNLSGPGQLILDHRLSIAASRMLDVDAALIPTGRLLPVTDTPMDFRREKPLGIDIGNDHPMLEAAGGYDVCYLLDKDGGIGPRPAARLTDPHSGRSMELRTTLPALQFYTANHLPPDLRGRNGALMPRRSGVCLEAQLPVDGPNRPEFGEVTLMPHEVYASTMEYRFSW